MINLYEKNETNFKHNAYVLNEIIKAESEEEINNGFNANITYPLHDSKELSSMLVPGNIIKLPSWDKREAQLFVIRRYKPSLDNCSVEVNLQHILTYRLDNNIVLDTYIEGKTRKAAIAQILSNTFHKHSFSVGNKDKNTTTNNLRIVRYSVLDALIGSKDNTVANRYGGELIYNNFTVDFVDSIGEDKGINIVYAKNITGANMTLEDTDLITEIIPLGKDGLMLPEKSIKSSNFDANNPYTRVIEFSNIGVIEAETDDDGNITNANEIVTQEQAYELLRQACRDKFNKEHVNEVSFNLSLNLVELADCINFEGNNYSNIDSKLAIGDTINVNIKPFDLIQKGRVYKLKRNVLTGELLNVEIGYKVKTLTDTINKTDNKIEETKEEVKETKTEIKKTKEKVKEESEQRKKLQVTMEANDKAIELSVANEVANRETAINILDGKIDLSVENLREDTEASITILEDEIELKVYEDDFGTLIEQNSSHVTIAIHDETDMLVTFDSDGQTIEDGSLKINNDGETVFYFNNGTACVKDIYFMDGGDEADNFIQAISEPKTIWVNDISGDDAEFDNLDVWSSKNCIVDTTNFGVRRINAYETAEYYFGDLGYGVIKDGLCIVTIDEIFKECVNTSIEYHVFIQAYNGSNVKVEKYEDYFIVYGEDDTEFSWEIKAKRIRYENVRLEEKGLVDEAQQKINTSNITNMNAANNNNIITTDLISKNNNIENDLLEVIGL